MLGNNNKRYSLKNNSAFKNTTASHDCFSPIIKRLQNRCFFVNIAKFLITVFFIKHLRWLLLSSFFELFFNCHPTGWLYSPARMRNSRFNKSPNFQTLQLFSIYMMKLHHLLHNNYVSEVMNYKQSFIDFSNKLFKVSRRS